MLYLALSQMSYIYAKVKSNVCDFFTCMLPQWLRYGGSIIDQDKTVKCKFDNDVFRQDTKCKLCYVSKEIKE